MDVGLAETNSFHASAFRASQAFTNNLANPPMNFFRNSIKSIANKASSAKKKRGNFGKRKSGTQESLPHLVLEQSNSISSVGSNMKDIGRMSKEFTN